MTPRGSTTEIRPRLRRDLRVSLRESAGNAYYQIEDPAGARFFRLGIPEWEFAANLNGKLSLAQALQSVYPKTNDETEILTAESAEGLVRWLVQNGLIDTATLPTDLRDGNAGKPKPPWNLFFIKIPLLHPDRWAARVLPWAAPLLTKSAFLVWCCLLLAGILAIALDWQRFLHSAAAYVSPNTWLPLWATWLALKAVHESFHGLVCRKYGGHIGKAGFMLILFSPVAFVDVTSSWRFRSKWQRIFTSAAGMYAEFGIAAVAALIWAYTETGFTNTVCHSVIIAASISTLLFNANPLMRFDGYYILADLLDFQNLASVARQRALQFAQLVFLGKPMPPLAMSRRRRYLLVVYGIASTCWKLLVSVSLILAASVLLHGAGIVLALIGFVSWFAKPLLSFSTQFLLSWKQMTPLHRRRLIGSTSVAAALVVATCFLPWPLGVVAPAIVQYADLEHVRARTDGFVETVHVQAGQGVSRGDVLLKLKNEPLVAEWDQARLALETSKIESRRLQSEQHLAAAQVESENYQALSEREKGLREQVDGLTVRAAGDGMILSTGLDDLVGRFVDAGDTLLEIGDPAEKELEISVPEPYIDIFSRRVGDRPYLRVYGQARRPGEATLVKVEPSATVVLRHAAWGGHQGGPIPVQAADRRDAEAPYQLVAPRFHGVIKIEPRYAASLHAGQLGEARFWDLSESVGRRVYRQICRWMQSKLGLPAH